MEEKRDTREETPPPTDETSTGEPTPTGTTQPQETLSQAGEQHSFPEQYQQPVQQVVPTVQYVQPVQHSPPAQQAPPVDRSRAAEKLAALVATDPRLKPSWVKKYLAGGMSLEELQKKRYSKMGPEVVAYLFDGLFILGIDGMLSVLEFVLDFVGIGEILQIGGDLFTTILPGIIMMSYARDNSTRMRMLGNILVDYIVGIIPFVGPIFDIFHKAHKKNLEILEGKR